MSNTAMDLRVPVTRIADIVNQRRRITADTALRFALDSPRAALPGIPEFASIDAELERLRVRKTELEGELKELVDAIAAGVQTVPQTKDGAPELLASQPRCRAMESLVALVELPCG